MTSEPLAKHQCSKAARESLVTRGKTTSCATWQLTRTDASRKVLRPLKNAHLRNKKCDLECARKLKKRKGKSERAKSSRAPSACEFSRARARAFCNTTHKRRVAQHVAVAVARMRKREARARARNLRSTSTRPASGLLVGYQKCERRRVRAPIRRRHSRATCKIEERALANP